MTTLQKNDLANIYTCWKQGIEPVLAPLKRNGKPKKKKKNYQAMYEQQVAENRKLQEALHNRKKPKFRQVPVAEHTNCSDDIGECKLLCEEGKGWYFDPWPAIMKYFPYTYFKTEETAMNCYKYHVYRHSRL